MAKTTLHSTPSLVDVLLGATAADLESIQATVAELERELAELVTDKSRQIDSLKAAAKLLGVRLHGKPPRKPRGGNAASERAVSGGHPRDSDQDPDSLRCQIYDAIVADGPQIIDDLCDRLSRTTSAVAACVSRCPWFVRTGDTVRIA